MICKQCGALIEDDAVVCDNCGIRLDIDEEDADKEAISEVTSPVPALREFAEDYSEKGGRISSGNIFVKCLSVVCSLICFVLFLFAARCVEGIGAIYQTQSFIGGIFGSSSSGFPMEFYDALHYAFLGMGVGLSAVILILGFKKN